MGKKFLLLCFLPAFLVSISLMTGPVSAQSGSDICVDGNCNSGDYSSSDPHVVISELVWENRVGSSDYDPGQPDQYGSACGDDANEFLIREQNSEEFNSEFEYACTLDENRCVINDSIYIEGETEDIGDARSDSENLGHSPDKEVCLNIDDGPGGSFYDLDQWKATEYIREKIDDNGGNLDGALESEEWKDFWKHHPDTEAVEGWGQLILIGVPGWYSYVGHEGPNAVPSILKDSRGGFALEDNCEPGETCQDLSSPSYPDRMWGNFTERGSPPDDYEDGTYDYSLDIVHNRMMIGGETGVHNSSNDASNDQDQETFRTATLESNPFTTSKIQEEFNQWGYTENLDHGVGPFGGIYDPGQLLWNEQAA